MKTHMQVGELATELARRREAAEDYVVDTRRMGFAVEQHGARPLLSVDDVDGEFAVNDHAQNQIAQRLGIPFRYFERMRDNHPDILTDTVGKLFVREPERRMVRTLDGQVRAFLSDKYRRLDYYELMDQSILPVLTKQTGRIEVLSLGLTDTRLYGKFLFPDVELFVPSKRGGDGGEPVHGGVAISNSEVGAGALMVEPFVYADYCTNGMIFGYQRYTEFGLRKQHVGRRIEDTEAALTMFSSETLRKDDDAFFSMVRDLFANSASGIHFAAIAEQMQRAAGLTVGGNPVGVVEVLAKQNQLRDTEKDSIMRHLIEGGDLSAWGYANAVTRTAEDVESYDRATELERFGGVLVDWSEKAWRELERASESVADRAGTVTAA